MLSHETKKLGMTMETGGGRLGKQCQWPQVSLNRNRVPWEEFEEGKCTSGPGSRKILLGLVLEAMLERTRAWRRSDHGRAGFRGIELGRYLVVMPSCQPSRGTHVCEVRRHFYAFITLISSKMVHLVLVSV